MITLLVRGTGTKRRKSFIRGTVPAVLKYFVHSLSVQKLVLGVSGMFITGSINESKQR
jgi:hypothetical protein